MELRKLGERQLKVAVYLSAPCSNATLCHLVVCSQVSMNLGQTSGKFDKLRIEAELLIMR